jgi:phytoene dehydrogenase-like protein
MHEAYDVVVVGAGIGGLTVGSLLKKYGDYKNGILLVEQSDRVGGRASSLTGEELMSSWQNSTVTYRKRTEKP